MPTRPVPNKNIIEGHLHEATASNVRPREALDAVQMEATLGLLARGTDGLAIWRRDDDMMRAR